MLAAGRHKKTRSGRVEEVKMVTLERLQQQLEVVKLMRKQNLIKSALDQREICTCVLCTARIRTGESISISHSGVISVNPCQYSVANVIK